MYLCILYIRLSPSAQALNIDFFNHIFFPLPSLSQNLQTNQSATFFVIDFSHSQRKKHLISRVVTAFMVPVNASDVREAWAK